MRSSPVGHGNYLKERKVAKILFFLVCAYILCKCRTINKQYSWHMECSAVMINSLWIHNTLFVTSLFVFDDAANLCRMVSASKYLEIREWNHWLRWENWMDCLLQSRYCGFQVVIQPTQTNIPHSQPSQIWSRYKDNTPPWKLALKLFIMLGASPPSSLCCGATGQHKL